MTFEKSTVLKCEDLPSLIQKARDKTLDPGDRDRVITHLDECEKCARQYGLESKEVIDLEVGGE